MENMAPLLEIEDVIENANLSVHQELNTIKSKAQLLEVLGSIPSQKSLDLQERIDAVMVNNLQNIRLFNSVHRLSFLIMVHQNQLLLFHI